ncbi:DUF2695 domain-containing protein [Alteromonas sp. A081]|uniref:DUF2695 domain-containing protein n=1 Tax=Alteromonas sp. A081 TaxID=3410269 RepID=UPI003B9822DE
MYILGSDKEIIDPELGMLQEALELLDSKLVSVESEIEASNDPDSDGILPWLSEQGGSCDCEILANVEEGWESEIAKNT